MSVAERPVPGPPGHFLRGNLPDFRRDRLGFLTNCARQYGDVFRLRLVSRRATVFCHPNQIEQVLVARNHEFRKHFALRINPLVLGNGLLVSDGDFWLRQRRLAQPAFLRQRVATYGHVVIDHTERLLGEWQDGQLRDMLPEMSRLTLGIIARALFDADISGLESTVGNALTVAQRNFLDRINMLVPMPLWVPTPSNLRLKRAVKQLDSILFGLIRQRRQSSEGRGDLLSLLLQARDEFDRTGMTDRQLRDEAMTLFLAGHETTALTLSWTWYLLATHPEAAARLQAEADAVIGERMPTVEDWPRLAFTEKVILEGMRLYPPAYVIGREPLADVVIDGCRVRKGDTVLLPQWVVHRDPRWFAEPERFLPERWTAELSRALPKFAYFPFGGGPRLCIGNTFAMMETVLALATIARKFHFTVVAEHPVIPWPTFTLRPLHGIKAVLSRRK
jgi:cytochrome P450